MKIAAVWQGDPCGASIVHVVVPDGVGLDALVENWSALQARHNIARLQWISDARAAIGALASNEMYREYAVTTPMPVTPPHLHDYLIANGCRLATDDEVVEL